MMKASQTVINVREFTRILVFDGAKNIEVGPRECLLQGQPFNADKERIRYYYHIKPASDRTQNLLSDVTSHKVPLREIPQHLRDIDQNNPVT